MPLLTITLPRIQLQRAKKQARREGFMNPKAWAESLIEKRLQLEEAPKAGPRVIISAMRKTKRYDPRFLRGLKESLAYADQAAQ